MYIYSYFNKWFPLNYIINFNNSNPKYPEIYGDHRYFSGYFGLELLNVVFDGNIPKVLEYKNPLGIKNSIKLILNNPLKNTSSLKV